MKSLYKEIFKALFPWIILIAGLLWFEKHEERVFTDRLTAVCRYATENYLVPNATMTFLNDRSYTIDTSNKNIYLVHLEIDAKGVLNDKSRVSIFCRIRKIDNYLQVDYWGFKKIK